MASQFIDLPEEGGGGGGAVSSVNSQTGAVVLDANDVGAASQQLDNLSATAVNVSISPANDDSINLGGPGNRWNTIYGSSLQTGTLIAQAGTISVNGDIFSLSGNGSTSQELLFQDALGSFYIGLKAPDTLTGPSVTLVLPDGDGSSGQFLSTDGAGVLSWASPAGGANSALSNLTTTSINQNLLPDADGTRIIGSALLYWDEIFLVQMTLAGVIKDSTGVSAIEMNRTLLNTDQEVSLNWSDPAGMSIGGAGGKVPLRFLDEDASNYAAITVPDVLAANYTLTLPPDDGLANQVLTTDGTGILSWTTPAGGGANTALSNLAATAVNTDILPGTPGTHSLGASGNNWANVWTDVVRTAGGVLSLIGSSGIRSSSLHQFSSAGLELAYDAGGFGIILKAPTLAANYTLTFPVDDGAVGQMLQTNGSGVLSWSGQASQLFTASADPGTAAAGQIYYNTTVNKIKMYNGTAWETVTSV